MVLADVTLGDLLWFSVALFFFMVWIMILFHIFGDLFADKSESGIMKFVWLIIIFAFPIFGVLVYLIVRGNGMTERAIAAQKRMNDQMAEYAQSVNPGNASEQIAQAKQLLDAGTIDQAEFDKLKAKALG